MLFLVVKCGFDLMELLPNKFELRSFSPSDYFNGLSDILSLFSFSDFLVELI